MAAAGRSPARGGGVAKAGAASKVTKRPARAATPKRVSPAARKKAAAAAAATAASAQEKEGAEAGESTADESQEEGAQAAPPPPPPPKKVVRKGLAKVSPAAKAVTPRKALGVAAGGVNKAAAGAKAATGAKGSPAKAQGRPPASAKKPSAGVGARAVSRRPSVGGTKQSAGGPAARKSPAEGAAKRGTNARAAKAAAEEDDDDEDVSDAGFDSAAADSDSDGGGGSDELDDEEEEDEGDLVPYDPTGGYKADAVSKADADSGDPEAPRLPCLTYASGDVDLKSVVSHAVTTLGEYSLLHPTAKIRSSGGQAPVAFVVGDTPRRSVRLLLALGRGAWIVDRSWALESISAGKWASFHEHALAAFPGATAARRALTAGEAPVLDGLRVGHRGRLNMDVSEFLALVRVAGGDAVQQRCDVIVVGSTEGEGGGQAGATGADAKLVNQRWLPDSICAWKTQPYHKYTAI